MAQPKPKKGIREQFSALNNIPRFFRMIWGVSPRMAILNGVLRLLQAAIPVSMLYVGKIIIDTILFLVQHFNTTHTIGDTSGLWWWLGAEFGLAIVNSLLGRGISLTESLLGDLVSNDSSVLIMRHAATLDLFQFEDAEFYDKLDRARSQTAGRTMLMALMMSQVQDLISMLFLIGGLAAFNPWLIVLLIVAVIPSFLGETHFNRRSYSLTHSWTPERRELDYLRFIGASSETAKEIKIFGLEQFLTNRFKTISDKYYEANKNLTIRRAGWGSVFSIIGTTSYYAAYVAIILQTIQGSISVGTLTFLAGSFQRMQGLLQGIMRNFARVSEMALYLQDFFGFLEMQPLSKSSTGRLRVPRPVRQGFEFENVSFKYPTSEKWALKNLSFTLRAGEKLALVGENGAGKTTIVKLLAHLYEPTEGRILLDGTDLNDYDPEDLRREIGIIFQDYFRYAFTASENIAVGNITERDNRHLIEEAAQKSLADEVIAGLPGKYDQMLGKRFSSGVDLSGGQWQKIALARAYMRDAQLIILDEPTASLDARAEHEVFLRFAELIKGKSGVLISHRFSTVRMADRILFLEHGRLLELGSHEELVAKGGKYAELFRLQAKGYV